MALPLTISGFSWPSTASGNLGPFKSSAGNIYIVGSGLAVYKATDPTSSFSAVDTSNAPSLTALYADAYQDGDTLHIMCVVSGGVTHYARFSMSSDAWVAASNYGGSGYSRQIYSPSAAPSIYFGGVAVRSDGDVIIAHPGENPVQHGGSYQEVAYSRIEGTSLTAGVLVASSGTKGDDRLYAKVVMGSSDQAHIGYTAVSNSYTFRLRALSSTNTLRTERTATGGGSNLEYLLGRAIYTRSSTETVVFAFCRFDDVEWVSFPHFTDDTNPTFTNGQIWETSAPDNTDAMTSAFSMVSDSNATNEDVYCGVIPDTDFDLYLRGDDGGSTWSDQNSSTAIQAGTLDGVSANIYTRGGFRVYAYIYDDAGTISYNEFQLYAVSETYSLTATEISSNSEVDNPVITEQSVGTSLTATEISSNSEVDTPAIAEKVSLTATDLVCAVKVFSEFDTISITYHSEHQYFSSGFPRTISSVSIGDASDDRVVIVTLVGESFNNSDPTDVTVGGVSATKVASHYWDTRYTSIWIAQVPTGTTADIVISNSGASGDSSHFVVHVCSGTGFVTTASDTSTAVGVNPTNTSISISDLTVPNGGVAIFAGYFNESTPYDGLPSGSGAGFVTDRTNVYSTATLSALTGHSTTSGTNSYTFTSSASSWDAYGVSAASFEGRHLGPALTETTPTVSLSTTDLVCATTTAAASAPTRTLIAEHNNKTFGTADAVSGQFSVSAGDKLLIVAHVLYAAGANARPWAVASSGISLTEIGYADNGHVSYPCAVRIYEADVTASSSTATITITNSGVASFVSQVYVYRISGGTPVYRQSKFQVSDVNNGAYSYTLDSAPFSVSEVLAATDCDTNVNEPVTIAPATGWTELEENPWQPQAIGVGHIMVRSGSTSATIAYDDLNESAYEVVGNYPVGAVEYYVAARPALTVDALLPVTISGATLSISHINRAGPYVYGGRVYFVSDEIGIYKGAANPADGFSAVDASNAPALSDGSLSSCFDGRYIHIAFVDSTNLDTHYARFDCQTDTWVEATAFGGSASTYSVTVYDPTTTPTGAWCSIAVRSDGDVLIFHPEEVVSTRQKGAITAWEGSSWTTTRVADASSANAQWGSIVVGKYDQCHIAYYHNDTWDFYTRILRADNTLSTERQYAPTNAAYSIHAPFRFRRAGVDYVGFQVLDTSSSWDIIYFPEYNDDSTPTFSEYASVPSENSANDQRNASSCADVFGIIYQIQQNATNNDLYLRYDQGTDTWADRNSGTAIAVGTSSSVQANIYARGGKTVVGYVWNDNGTLKYDEFELYSSVTLGVGDFSSASSVDAPALTVNEGVNLTATEINSNSDVDNPLITQNHSLTATEINSNSEVDTPLLTQNHSLNATEISSTSEVDTPAITQNHSLTASEINSNSEVDTSDITENYIFTATEIDSVSEVDSSSITQEHTLTVTEIESTTEVDNPLFTGYSVFTATEISSTTEVVTPAITQNHSLNAVEVESFSDVDTSNITENYVFAATEINSNSDVDNPLITQNHSLTATEIESASEVETSDITENNSLIAIEISSTTEIDASTITQNHVLSAVEISSTTEVDNPVISQNHSLTATEISSTSEVDNPLLTGYSVFTATEISSSTEVDTPAITQNHVLTATEINSTTEVDTSDITENSVFTATEISSSTEVDTPAITQNHVLTATEISSNSEVDNAQLDISSIEFTATEITSTTEVDNPVVKHKLILTANNIESTSEVDTPAITQNHSLTATEINSNSEVDTSDITENYVFTATEINSNSEVDTPAISQNHSLNAVEINSNSEVDNPLFTGYSIFTATEIDSVSEVDTPVITQNHSLNATEINSNSEVDSPAITQSHSLTASEISSSTEVDNPVIVEGDTLIANNINSITEVDSPAITQEHALTATEINSNSEVDTSDITENYVFAATEISSTTEVDTPAITQNHSLNAVEINSNSEVTNPVITQIHSLTATEIEIVSEVDTSDITQNHSLTASEINSTTEIDTPAITQNHVLISTEISSITEIDNPDISQNHSLTASEISSTTEVDTSDITENYVFVSTEIQTVSEVDTPAITQNHVLISTEIESASEVESPVIVEGDTLLSSEIQSISEVDTPAITQNHVLTATEIESASEVESSDITQNHSLIATEISSSTEVDTPVITQNHVLTATEINSTTEVDNPAITQNHSLNAVEIQSVSEVDTSDITENYVFAVTEIESVFEVDSPAITQEHALTVTEISSTSEIDTPNLLIGGVLLASSIESTTEVDNPNIAITSILVAEEIESTTEVDNSDIIYKQVLAATDIEIDTETINGQTVTCHGVQISHWNQYVHIAELEVYAEVGGVNTNIVDINTMTASQSTNWSLALYPANNAIDGNTSTFSHTLNGNTEWFRLEFNSPYDVTSLRIYNRPDVGSRLNGAVVSLLDDTNRKIVNFPAITGASDGSIHDIAILGPNLNQNHSLTATEIDSASEVDTSDITENYIFTATEINSTSEVDNPAITQNHSLNAVEINSNSEIDNSNIVEIDILNATEINSTTEVDSPAITQTHALTAAEIEAVSEVDTRDITQENKLIGNDIVSTTEVDSPAITQSHSLTAAEIEAVSEVDHTSLVVNAIILSAVEVSSASDVENPVITQLHSLNANDISSTSEVENFNLTENYELSILDIVSESFVDNSEFSQIHNLFANNLQSNPLVDQNNIEQTHVLSSNNITSLPILDQFRLVITNVSEFYVRTNYHKNSTTFPTINKRKCLTLDQSIQHSVKVNPTIKKNIKLDGTGS